MAEDEPLETPRLDIERKWSFFWWRVRESPRLCWLALLRVLRAASRTAALFLTIFGVLLAAIALGFTVAGRDLPSDLPAAGWLLVSLVTSFVAAGFFTLWMLPPPDLAKLLIEGKKSREIFEVMALRIRRLAMRFVRETEKVSEVPDVLLEWVRKGTRSGVRDSLIDEIILAIDAIDDLCRAEDINFRRIDAMKRAAAQELGLSYRSLCDHILQFSPVMFQIGVGKYLRNLQEMVELATAADFQTADASRFRGLIDQNKRLEKTCRDRATIQELLLRFHELHRDIRALASTRSTSGALQAYSCALAELARLRRPLLEGRSWRRGWRRWSGSVDDHAYIATYERFLFLFRRRRAHPGFDLHALLRQAVDRMAMPPFESHFDRGLVVEQRSTLRALDRHGKGRAKDERDLPPPVSGLARLAPAGKGNNPAHRKRFLERLGAMSQLHRYFNRAVSLCRSAMQPHFDAVLDAWYMGLAPEAVAYVVTGGYSKTVREMIRVGLGSARSRQEDRPSWKPHLFQLLAGDEDELDSRLMTWELQRLWGHSEEEVLAAGSGEMLVSLARSGDRVLVLLGAEAVDSGRQVVHPRSVIERLEPVIRRLIEKRIAVLVVVAAESFKHFPGRFAGVLMKQKQFERIGVYEASVVDLVVSDSGTDPGDWQWVIGRRLQLPRPGVRWTIGTLG